jgi:hypothetical protein
MSEHHHSVGPRPAEPAAASGKAASAGEDAPLAAEDALRADREPPTAEDAPPDELAGKPGGSPRSGAGLRLLGAAFTLPWLILYGVTGAWAVTRGAKAAAEGLKQLDVGYSRFVTPAQVIFFGALLLSAFAVMMACALLLLYGRRSAMVWLPLLLVATGLTAGSIWASVRGDLAPILWASLFFGLAYVSVVAFVRVLMVTRAERRGTIGAP